MSHGFSEIPEPPVISVQWFWHKCWRYIVLPFHSCNVPGTLFQPLIGVHRKQQKNMSSSDLNSASVHSVLYDLTKSLITKSFEDSVSPAAPLGGSQFHQAEHGVHEQLEHKWRLNKDWNRVSTPCFECMHAHRAALQHMKLLGLVFLSTQHL